MRTENKHYLIENRDLNMHSLLLVIADTVKGNFTKMCIIKTSQARLSSANL